MLRWTPRIAGLIVGGFMALLALDSFPAGTPVLAALPGFALHLVPAFMVWGAVALSWRWPVLGGLTFIALAVACVVAAWPLPWSWALAISGPLGVVGILFVLSGPLRRSRTS